MKKTLIILLVLALCLPLFSACGGRADTREKQVLDHVYAYTEKTTSTAEKVGAGYVSASTPSLTADGYAYAVTAYDRNYELQSAKIVFGDFDGEPTTCDLPAEFAQGAVVLRAKDGAYLYAQIEEVHTEDDFEFYDYIPTLCRLDASGRELSRKPLTDVFAFPEDDYYYVEYMLGAGNRQFLLLSGSDAVNNKVAIFEDGEFVDFCTLPLDDGVYLNSAVAIDETHILCTYYDDTTQGISAANCDLAGGQAEKLPVSDYQKATSLFADGEGGFYYVAGDGIYRMRDTGGDEFIMDFVNSDYLCGDERFIRLDDGRFATLKMDNDENGNLKKAAAFTFTAVDESSLAPKYIIEVASSGYAYDFQKQIVAFNLSQDEYRIRYTDYAKFNTEEDYLAGQKKLADDLLSGRVPDVLISDALFNPAKYIDKGLFADLYTYLDKDATVNRAAFLPNILRGAEQDGKLYELPTAFYAYTFAGIEDAVKPFDRLTMEQFTEKAEALPEGVSFIRRGDMRRDTLLDLLFWINYSDFIDAANKKVTLNNAEFRALLDFCRSIPEKSVYEEEGFDYDTFDWEAYGNAYKDGKAIAMPMALTGFDAYDNCSYYFGNQRPYFATMPNADAAGYGFVCGNLRLMVAADSTVADAAWDFVRLFFTEEAQTSLNYYFPVTEQALSALREKALEKIKARDAEEAEARANGEEYYIDEESYRTAAEDIETLYRIAHEADHAIVIDQDLADLIYEEATGYLAGEKSFETVAGNLESRIMIKISE